MSIMGKYCKAYPLAQLRRFPHWSEASIGEHKLEENAYVFLQDNYSVTVGIFMDEKIVFNQVTDDWKAFCENDLQFSIPEYARKQTISEPVTH